MKHTGTETIETKRLKLRRFKPDDAGEMYTTWACDPEVTRWMRWIPHKHVGETRAIVDQWVEAYEKQDTYHWAIVLKESDKVIGSIGIFESQEPTEPAGWEPGYCIGRAYWGKGLPLRLCGRWCAIFLQAPAAIHCIAPMPPVTRPAGG